MDTLTPEERVWKTFNHEEPDRIPIYEGAIEPPSLNRKKKMVHLDPGALFFPPDLLKILGGSHGKPLTKLALKAMEHPQFILPFVKPSIMKYTAIYRKYGVDFVGFIGGMPMIFKERLLNDIHVTKESITMSNGKVATVIPKNGGAVSRNGILRSPEDYEKYIEMDPDHPMNHIMVPNALKAAKGKIALVFTIYGSAYFENMCELFGFETLFRLMIKDPHFIDRVVKDMSDYANAVVAKQAELGARIFYMTDDIGQIGRPLVSPRMYKRFFTEGIKKYCRTVHKYGGKIMRHSDGNITELIPTFIEEGIDALHPWEGDAGMDIFAAKQKWGKQLTIIGNVPIAMLSDGTPKDIVAYVKRLCRECGPGGGYILTSSHSIVFSVQWQNYMAMLWAGKKFGTYPIKHE